MRPTGDKVKEAVFSVIQFDVEGKTVLDLFAGSGQLGLEALSRGASRAVFVDKNRAAHSVLRQNISNCGFDEQTQLIQTDAIAFLQSNRDKFSLVFLDPPYGVTRTGAAGGNALTLLEEALLLLPPILADDAIVVAEAPANQALPSVLGALRGREYRYGKVKVCVYRPINLLT